MLLKIIRPRKLLTSFTRLEMNFISLILMFHKGSLPVYAYRNHNIILKLTLNSKKSPLVLVFI